MADTESYLVQFCGGCLGDLIPNGTMLVAEPSAAISPMDVVSVILRQTEGPFSDFVNTIGADYVGVCKLFLGCRQMPDGETVYLVAQLSPPAISPIPASAILALHRVVDGQVPKGATEAASDDDSRAIALLAPFAGTESVEPIAPDWTGNSFGRKAA